MKNLNLDKFVALWSNDDAFRSAFRANPQAAVRSRGITLDSFEWDAVSAMGLSGASKALDQRISPEGASNGSANGYC